MENRTDKNSYTIIFVIVMVMVVGALLSFLASEDGLKPLITENKRIEKQQNILYAMGVNRNQDDSSVNFIPTTEVVDERMCKRTKARLARIVAGLAQKIDPN